MDADRPPSCLAQRILRCALPPDRRDDITGDLEEVYRRLCSAHGAPA